MKLTHDPFVGRLLAALVLYAAMVTLWMHAAPTPTRAQTASETTPMVRGVR